MAVFQSKYFIAIITPIVLGEFIYEEVFYLTKGENG